MSALATISELLAGLGLFFIGVRALSANLVPLMGRRARAAFARALRGRMSCAIGGTIAGAVTQSSTAVSWIVVSFVRAGILTGSTVLLAPVWANVGTALLPLLVAFDTSIAAGIVIGAAGFASYFKLVKRESLKHAMEAALGAAMLLFGMHLVALAVGPIRDGLMHLPWWEAALDQPLVLALIGAIFSCVSQSSSVSAAIAVAAMSGGLLDLPAALPLVAGANAAGMINNAVLIPGETTAGRLAFALQVAQKGIGALFLAVVATFAALYPGPGASLLGLAGSAPDGQLAILFLLAQIVGAAGASLIEEPTRRLMLRLMPVPAVETLAQPAFLMREALNDPAAALDLTLHELGRLSARLPQMLDHIRDEPDLAAPSPAVLRTAGVTLAGAIRAYLTSLLDNQPTRPQVATALLLEDAAVNASALHEALAELADASVSARALPAAGRLVEALHALLGTVADHAEDPAADDPDMVLSLLGHRDKLMEELRLRLSSQEDVGAEAQNALFRMTVLFERIVWLARRLVNDLSQARRSAAG
ncbi:Na/Pi symporter [Ancylobacter sp. G4_0304]|uniref:Na/Pi symporter n=1 Tax=Ancylobacter sp. G4_0304 TaxID=3114289 RepID=UPI0039C6CFBF